MKCDLYGNIEKPAVVLVGTWDPLVRDHFVLIERAEDHCLAREYQLLLVLLDPFPSNLLLDRVMPIFECPAARINSILQKTSGAVCKISMTRPDVDAGVREFLDALQPYAAPAELWLHPGQSLGRCTEGSRNQIDAVCRSRSIAVKDIPPSVRLQQETADIRKFLQQGGVENAANLTGRPSLWQKPASGEAIKVGWQTGRYAYRPVPFSANGSPETGGPADTLEVFLNDDGHAVFEWPDSRLGWLAIDRRCDGESNQA